MHVFMFKVCKDYLLSLVSQSDILLRTSMGNFFVYKTAISSNHPFWTILLQLQIELNAMMQKQVFVHTVQTFQFKMNSFVFSFK